MDETKRQEIVRGLIVTLLLVGIMLFAFFVRTYFAWGISVEEGFSVSGGSDSYYHERIIEHIINTGHHLVNEPLLNYPLGVTNPRPPFFHWLTVAGGIVLYPFYGDLDTSSKAFLVIVTALFGALTAIPIYLMGRESFNRRVGLVAAALLSVSAAHMMRSVATNADWDALTLFLALFAFYFFMRALKTTVYTDSDWGSPRKAWESVNRFLKHNRVPVIYAALGGASLGTMALTWKGYSYALVILLVYTVIQMFINRFRNRSVLHLTVYLAVFALVGFGMSLPWYAAMHRLNVWYIPPLALTVLVIGIGMYFEATARYPWVMVFTLTVLALGALAAVAYFFIPDLWNAIVSGQGYFVKSKLYTTIAEAQPTTLGRLIMSFGVATFFMSIFGLVYLIWTLRKKFNEYYIFFLVFSAFSIYMAISAARFIFTASPAFALTAAIVLSLAIDKLRLSHAAEMYRKSRKTGLKAVKETVKISHVAGVSLLVLLVVIPNVWGAIDAGIPYEEKKTYDESIYNSMPEVLRPNKSAYENARGTWYLGAFGYSVPRDTYPWPRAWAWFRTKDTQLPEEKRPAFLSWWDYGFEAVQEGKHPTVADNFQFGYQFAGQFITAQNESEAIALFIARLLEGDYRKHDGSFSPQVLSILEEYLPDEVINDTETALSDPGTFRERVLQNPGYYGKYSSDISDVNLRYVVIKARLANSLSTDELVDLLREVEDVTGKEIRYFAVDYRLFPFSGRNTGIFYAPAKLSDRRVVETRTGSVVPIDFYEIYVVDEYGNEHPIQSAPPGIKITKYKIVYKDMFYNSMLYRAFIGYSGKEVGLSDGIPGISQDLYDKNPMQAWNLTHFKLVYKTVYWNPYENYQDHPEAWRPVSLEEGVQHYLKGEGRVDLFPPAYQVLPNDVVFIKFYEGAIVEGRVTMEDGTPLPGVRVTLYDEYGIPHTTTLTDQSGYYRLYSVAGNITLRFTTDGDYDKLTMAEKTVLAQKRFNVTEEQATREVGDRNMDGVPDYIITMNVQVRSSASRGFVYYDENLNGAYDQGEEVFQGADVVLRNDTLGLRYEFPAPGGYYIAHGVPPHTYSIYLNVDGTDYPTGLTYQFASGQNYSRDIPAKPSRLYVTVTYRGERNLNLTTLNFTVKSDTREYHFSPASNGSAVINLLPGEYRITLNGEDYVMEPQNVTFTRFNETHHALLNVYDAAVMEGRVDGHITGATGIIAFYEQSGLGFTKVIRIPQSGYYRVTLPKGVYSVYVEERVGEKVFANFRTVVLERDMRVDIGIQEAYPLTVEYIYKGKGASEARAVLFRGGDILRMNANTTGVAFTYVPAGNYVIGANHFPLGEPKAKVGYTEFTVSGPTHVTVTLTNYTTPVRISVREVNGEPVNNGLAILRVGGIPVYALATVKGNVTLYSPTEKYSVDVLMVGREVVSTDISGERVNVTARKKAVQAIVHVLYGGTPFRRDVTLTFVSETGENITATTDTGEVEVFLPPGTYSLNVVSPGLAVRVDEPENVTVDVGEEYTEIWMNITPRAWLNISGRYISVFRQDGGVVSHERATLLPLGEYTVYVTDPDRMTAAIDRVNLNGNTTLTLIPSEAYFLNITVDGYDGTATLTVRTGDIMMNFTVAREISLILPPGTYELYLHAQTYEEGVEYAYRASASVELQRHTDIVMTTSAEEVRYRLDVIATEDGVPAQYAIVEVYSGTTGVPIQTVTADVSGRATLYLTPDMYIIYIRTGSSAYVKRIAVKTDTLLDARLMDAHTVSGGYFLNGEMVQGILKVDFEEGFTWYIRVNGAYTLLLPDGNYTFRSEMSRQEYGMSVGYTFSRKFTLHGDMVVDIVLTRNTKHSVSLELVEGQSDYVGVGSYATVVFSVMNNGNIPETVRFESGADAWEMEFYPSQVTVEPAQTAYVTAYIKVPESADYGENDIAIVGRYWTTATRLEVVINASEYHNITLGDASYSMSGDTLVLKIHVINGGNVDVNVTVLVNNIEELTSLGWTVDDVQPVSLQPGEGKDAVILMKHSGGRASRSFQVYVSANDGHMTAEEGVEVSVPQISLLQIEIQGNNVAPVSAQDYTPWYVIIAGVAVLLVALHLSSRRR